MTNKYESTIGMIVVRSGVVTSRRSSQESYCEKGKVRITMTLASVGTCIIETTLCNQHA